MEKEVIKHAPELEFSLPDSKLSENDIPKMKEADLVRKNVS
jgi:hypothetical protein